MYPIQLKVQHSIGHQLWRSYRVPVIHHLLVRLIAFTSTRVGSTTCIANSLPLLVLFMFFLFIIIRLLRKPRTEWSIIYFVGFRSRCHENIQLRTPGRCTLRVSSILQSDDVSPIMQRISTIILAIRLWLYYCRQYIPVSYTHLDVYKRQHTHLYKLTHCLIRLIASHRIVDT